VLADIAIMRASAVVSFNPKPPATELPEAAVAAGPIQARIGHAEALALQRARMGRKLS